mgnify:FL=1
MSITSGWPLSNEGIRFLTPRSLCDQLASDPLTQNLYLIAMGYYPKALHHKMERQKHHNTLIIYCTAGKGVVVSDEVEYQVKAGDLILLPKNQAHQYRADDIDPWSIYWLHVDGLLTQALCQHLAMEQPVVSIGLQPQITAQLESLFSLRHSGYNLAAFIHGSHALQQLLSYFALLVRNQRSQSDKRINLDHIQVLMNEHLHGHLDLDTMASHSQLSKYHFSKRFKELTGHSPVQYFIILKMQHACWLLDIGQQQIKQIASAVGYDDPYYFSRIFKKVIGLSPMQYRRSKH